MKNIWKKESVAKCKQKGRIGEGEPWSNNKVISCMTYMSRVQAVEVVTKA